MQKIIVLAICAFLLFAPAKTVFALDASASATPAPKTSYELFYPIVAGKIPGDQFYSLKLFREWVASLFIFDNIKKSDFHLTLSKKRLVESEKLIQENKSPNLIKDSLGKSLLEYQKAVGAAGDAKSKGEATKDIYNTLKADGDIISGFLGNLSKTGSGEIENDLLNLSQKFKDIANSI